MIPAAVDIAYKYRGGLLEVAHRGRVCVVSESGVQHSVGDPNAPTFFRSSSKPMQSLPFLARDPDNKYGFTAEETAILSGSHHGEPPHIAALESILVKAELSEPSFVMKPAYPSNEACARALIAQGLPPRKIYHTCFGKHVAMQLLSRELGLPVGDYWRMDSPVHGEILRTIKLLSGANEKHIQCGIDG